MPLSPASASPSPASPLAAFIAGLPKTELHVHQVGSASPRIVAQLAERHPGVVPADPEALAAYFQFDDFAHFISIYLSVVKLVETAEDVRLLTYEIGREMAEQQIRYAELTVTPYLTVTPELPAEAFLEAIHQQDRIDKRIALLSMRAAGAPKSEFQKLYKDLT